MKTFSAYYLKKIDISNESDDIITIQPLVLTKEVFSIELESSYLNFIEKIGNKVPSEYEYNNWKKKNKL